MVATSSQHSGTATTTLAKPKLSGDQDRHEIFSRRGFLPQEVRAGDAEIDLSVAQVLGNFGGREESDFNIVDAFQLAAIAAIRA